MKAYVVSDKDDRSTWCYVMAEKPSHAKARAMASDDSGYLFDEGWITVKVRRAPEYDDGITWRKLFAHGHAFVWCPACGCQIRPNEKAECIHCETEHVPHITPHGIYCCETCEATTPQPHDTLNIDAELGAMCLYADY